MIPIIILAINDDDDREFMIWLYTKYKRLIYSIIYSIVKNHADAEDVMQDVVEKLIEALDRIKQFDQKSLASYVAATAKNHALNYINRSEHRKVTYLADYEYWEDPGPDMENSLIHKTTLENLAAIWDDLKDETKQILEMKYFLCLSDQEIGQYFGVLPRSVRMRLTRARREVKKALESYQSNT